MNGLGTLGKEHKELGTLGTIESEDFEFFLGYCPIRNIDISKLCS